MHYMLSMKSVCSPFALAFRTSHEKLNPYHRLSGRIIYAFLIFHAFFYMNFFIRAGLVKIRLSQRVPLMGVLAFTLLTILASTSLTTIRRWSYRVFFVCHLTFAVAILPILFFHAKPARLYVVEALTVFVLDLIARKLDTFTSFSKIESISGTKLLKLNIPIPTSKIQRFQEAPGQHVYLSLPSSSIPTKTSYPLIYAFLHNPFTVAEVSDTGIVLVLRTLKGPTTAAFESLTKLTKAKPRLNVEGPCGSSRHFPNLAVDFDRILLVAGGVGAAFILPIYQWITASLESTGQSTKRLELIWSMRSVAEASWAMPRENISEVDGNIKIYITGLDYVGNVAEPSPEDGSVEMGDLQRTQQPGHVSGGHERPNLRAIVDRTFRHGTDERVAVLVCGPAEMARDLREHTGRWVAQGRYVWWHDESFGW